MLVLSRQKDESIMIGDGVEVFGDQFLVLHANSKRFFEECYQFEDAGSALNSGSAGAAYDGTYVGGLSLGTGQVGQAATFDGLNDLVTVPTTSSSLGGTGSLQLTFEAWVNVAVPSSPPSPNLARIMQSETPFCDVVYDFGVPAGTTHWRLHFSRLHPAGQASAEWQGQRASYTADLHQDIEGIDEAVPLAR